MLSRKIGFFDTRADDLLLQVVIVHMYCAEELQFSTGPGNEFPESLNMRQRRQAWREDLGQGYQVTSAQKSVHRA